MDHPIIESEMRITAEMDFIVPLKQVGLITRAVLEAIHLFYRPRRTIVVSAAREEKTLLLLLPHWNVGYVEFIAEETFFHRNLHLSFADIIAEYDAQRPGDKREPGWWIQQLIKLGAATQIPNISDYYVVWDGDLVPTRRWRVCQRNADGSIHYFIAILQDKSRSEFNTVQYAGSMRALTNMEPLDPPQGGTFVAHHMVFSRKYLEEMLQLMRTTTGSDRSWPLLIMSFSRRFFRFSEYKTYATFMLRYHPDEFHYHELQLFGDGGLRFREANTVVEDMLSVCRMSNGGLSYNQIKDYMSEHWQRLSNEPGHAKPAYVQLDHVYGLDGIDLNIAEESSACTSTETSFDEDMDVVVHSPDTSSTAALVVAAMSIFQAASPQTALMAVSSPLARNHTGEHQSVFGSGSDSAKPALSLSSETNKARHSSKNHSSNKNKAAKPSPNKPHQVVRLMKRPSWIISK